MKLLGLMILSALALPACGVHESATSALRTHDDGGVYGRFLTPWERVTLKSAAGYEIQLNYRVQATASSEASRAYFASPLWLNVKRPDHGTSLHAVILNYEASTDPSGPTFPRKLSSATNVDLRPDPSHGADAYAIQVTEFGASDGLGIGGHNGSRAFERDQEIALVNEKGEWQKDPVSGGSNFRFDLLKAADLP
jgi:hypothetical protein